MINPYLECCRAPEGKCDARLIGCTPGERDPSHSFCQYGTKPGMFHSKLWRREPPEGDMFIWAFWDPVRGTWQTGLGYWNKSGGWSANPGYQEPKARFFHPMPTPPAVTE